MIPTLPSISVLGCGWLGLPLAERLVKENYSVKGSTTSNAKTELLSSKGVKPYLLELNPSLASEAVSDFFQSDVLFINIPPGLRRREGSFHLKQIESILEHVKDGIVKKIIFISSTSVYPDTNQEMKEADVTTLNQAESKILFEAETMIRENSNTDFLILRCAGLTGYDRILVKHFAGKENLMGGSNPANMVHRDDVVEIITQLLRHNRWNETYNICAPLHPTRKEFYTDMALRYDFALPHFAEDTAGKYKIINGDKLTHALHYKYLFPNPLKFEYSSQSV